MRQAVVIIHGIGEQRPMETLRAFVAGALGVEQLTPVHHVYSKPDRISETLELRRLHAQPGCYGERFELGCETDFYELYWQHLMQGTSWRPVLEWALHLLCHPGKLNTRLFAIWKRVVSIILGIVAIVALGVVWLESAPLWQRAGGLTIVSIPLVGMLGWLGWRALKWLVFGRVERLVLGYLGDAVRYLNPDPPNIEARRAVRTAALTLLRGLHEDKLRRYERIVVVGHSLGSVIAYDAITWLWQELHHLVEPDPNDRRTVQTRIAQAEIAMDELPLERLGAPQSTNDETFRKRQRELWESQRKDRLPWRITDLVTLGSPLAHADVLLADGRHVLELGVAQREFPKCPPTSEDDRDRKLLWREYDAGGSRCVLRILHHGAPFAVTRWTNLYYPGDFIGGPLSCLFGTGVRDVRLSSDRRGGRAAHSWRSHTAYWHTKEKAARGELRTALDLNWGCCGPVKPSVRRHTPCQSAHPEDRTMTKYLVSFPGPAMNISSEDMAAVGEAAHAVIREAKAAGVYVFGGGINEDIAPLMVAADGSITNETYPQTKEFDGGFCVLELPSREAAVKWAAKIAQACRCSQELREFQYDPES